MHYHVFGHNPFNSVDSDQTTPLIRATAINLHKFGNICYISHYFLLCNNSDRTWFFNALTFARSLGMC